jgi:hypothetical protein
VEEDLAAFGLVASEPLGDDQPDFEVWPDCWDSVHLFVLLSTQWRLSPEGHLLGLDYAAIPPVLELLEVAREQRGELFADLRVMEQAALKELRKHV